VVRDATTRESDIAAVAAQWAAEGTGAGRRRPTSLANDRRDEPQQEDRRVVRSWCVRELGGGVGCVVRRTPTAVEPSRARLLLLLPIITWRSKHAAYCAAVRGLCLVASESPTSSLSTIPLANSPRSSVARTRSIFQAARKASDGDGARALPNI